MSTSSSNSRRIAQLRATLNVLEEIEPDRKLVDAMTLPLDDDDKKPLLDPSRFEQAKQHYLQQRLGQTFMDGVGTYKDDDKNGTSTLALQAPMPTASDWTDLQKQRDQVRQDLIQRLADTHATVHDFQTYHRVFQTRKKELETMIQELESNHENDTAQDSDDDDDDDDVEDQDLEYQQERLHQLQAREQALREELAQITNETASRTQSLALQQSNGPSAAGELGKVDIATAEAEARNMRMRAQELDTMTAWYQSINAAVQELGGVRIVSVKENGAHRSTTTTGDKENAPTSDTSLPPSAILLTLELAYEHMVLITLSPTNQNNKKNNEMAVVSAKYLTNTTLEFETLANDDDGSNSSPSATTLPPSKALLTLPPLDDLVQVAQRLGPVHDLRFVVREAHSRILTLTSRIAELAHLRARYVTKLHNLRPNASQEIICSLNCGIACGMHLTPDCPLVTPSVAITELVGLGGWDSAVLDEIQQDLKNNHEFASPMELMHVLEEKLAPHIATMPGTPSMPSRQVRE